MDGDAMEGDAMEGGAMEGSAMEGGAMDGGAMEGGAMQGRGRHAPCVRRSPPLALRGRFAPRFPPATRPPSPSAAASLLRTRFLAALAAPCAHFPHVLRFCLFSFNSYPPTLRQPRLHSKLVHLHPVSRFPLAARRAASVGADPPGHGMMECVVDECKVGSRPSAKNCP